MGKAKKPNRVFPAWNSSTIPRSPVPPGTIPAKPKTSVVANKKEETV